MNATESSFIAGLVVGCAFAWLVMSMLRSDHGANEFAWMLGRTCEARKYECYDWQLGTVVAVSWKGAVRFRSMDGSEGFWIEKPRVKYNVKFVGEGNGAWFGSL